ncbi:MAG: hypothetical protein ACREBS_09070, partial [Nitrososphaerales archaeon]
MSPLARARASRAVYVPAAVSSFFEICDRNPDGTTIADPLKIGSRGGGFVIERGTITRAFQSNSDLILINNRQALQARTTRAVLELMRSKFEFGKVRISHKIDPPIGSGFGTSGSGALGAAVALSDLFELKLSLVQASAFAHEAEIKSLTGLGTVISLASGTAAIGLVTEPGTLSVGRVDAILDVYDKFALVCACFGPIAKSTVLREESKRNSVNQFGRMTLDAVLEEPTPESLLKHSRSFAEKTAIATKDLLALSDGALKLGAVGATQNMIGNAVHCLIPKSGQKTFVKSFRRLVPANCIFESGLIQSGPR